MTDTLFLNQRLKNFYPWHDSHSANLKPINRAILCRALDLATEHTIEGLIDRNISFYDTKIVSRSPDTTAFLYLYNSYEEDDILYTAMHSTFIAKKRFDIDPSKASWIKNCLRYRPHLISKFILYVLPYNSILAFRSMELSNDRPRYISKVFNYLQSKRAIMHLVNIITGRYLDVNKQWLGDGRIAKYLDNLAIKYKAVDLIGPSIIGIDQNISDSEAAVYKDGYRLFSRDEYMPWKIVSELITNKDLSITESFSGPELIDFLIELDWDITNADFVTELLSNLSYSGTVWRYLLDDRVSPHSVPKFLTQAVKLNNVEAVREIIKDDRFSTKHNIETAKAVAKKNSFIWEILNTQSI